MNPVYAWLLESEPYVRYRVRLDLLDQAPDDAEVLKDREAMLTQPLVQGLFQDLASWPGEVITNHKKADLLIHKLAFAAELGITLRDPGMETITQRILAHTAPQGIPEIPIRIPRVFGGTDKDVWAWTLCDTPRILFSLLKMGVRNEALSRSMDTLAGLVRENGWPCAASPTLGRFRGPGKSSDPCPYATLLMLSALLQAGDANRAELRNGAESLLALWQNSREQYPYLFHMGTDFRKLKAPFIWYDILHVADVLTRLPWLQTDARLVDMLRVIRSKADANGLFTPESVWMAWKGWDFAQKKAPSPWLTFCVLRILKRAEFNR